MRINHSHIGQVVTFLYGAKGYGEGVLLSIDGDQARVKTIKLRETPSCTWTRNTEERSTYAPYVCVKNSTT